MVAGSAVLSSAFCRLRHFRHYLMNDGGLRRGTPLLDMLRNAPVYVFHHIGKTAGTSVRLALERWFFLVEDYNPGGERKLEYLANPVKLRELSPMHCLCGHYGKGLLWTRYPEIFDRGRFRVFAFVRDPLEVKISQYYFRLRMNWKRHETLREHLFDENSRPNFMASFFGCGEENFREVLDRYFFIGVVEELARSLELLGDLISRPRVDLLRLNESKRDFQAEDLSREDRAKFREMNLLDYRIYELCCERLASR